MEHQKSKVIVYSTTDYKRFRFIEGNRETETAKSKSKRARILSEIKAGNDILDESPILVNESKSHLDIKDGQNRFLIAKSLGRPVHYIIKNKEMSLYNLAKINTNVEKWSSGDYINCYIKAGNENYKLIQKFQKKYGIAIGLTLSLLTNGIEKANDSGHDAEVLIPKFQQGNFEVKKYKDACMIAELCMSFQGFSQWFSRPFVIAIMKIMQAGKCDFQRMMSKFNRDPKRLQTQRNWKEYVTNLEQIYNLDNAKRVQLV
jgi:hypothetical protein